MEFMPPLAVFNTVKGGFKKLTLLIFLGGLFEMLI
jgi:hypothetical protein